MEMLMIKLAFFARFEAKPGKEEAVAKFLEMALDMAQALMAKAPELFSSPPSIEPVELLGSK